uniref:Uncharacterized protein n=1 Tax=Leptobrachium leishanense TaxID=445787 RepID=A0A8C5WFR5_9ANUR
MTPMIFCCAVMWGVIILYFIDNFTFMVCLKNETCSQDINSNVELVRNTRELSMSSWEKDNMYIKIVKLIFKESKKNDSCWICSHAPHSLQYGFPFTGVTINLQELIDHGNLTQYSVIEKEPSRVHLQRNVNYGAVMMQQCDSGIYQDFKVSPINLTILFRCKMYEEAPVFTTFNFTSTPTSDRKFLTQQTVFLLLGWPLYTSQSSRTGLPFGYYWLCGRWATKVIPLNHFKPCFLGFVLPAFNIHDTLPEGKIRLKRAAFRTSIKSDLAEVIPAGLFWFIGISRLYKKLNYLVDDIDDAFNYTEDSILKLSAEQEQMRIVALQNRLALDYLLAAQGGVCQLVGIGDSCCTYIKDQSGAIEHDMDELDEVRARLRKAPTGVFEGFDWTFGLGSWIGNLGKKILMGCIVVLFIFIAIYVFVMLLKCLCKHMSKNINTSKPKVIPLDNRSIPPQGLEKTVFQIE